MAASLTLTEAQVELINSLPQDDIPAKLRCAICSKLAINAFRLPCCEQAICESCQSTLPASCPVCEHSPLSADDCKPHKALRTTIKVFLRTEEKKRESNRPKGAAPTPITPVEPSPVTAAAPAIPERPLGGEAIQAGEDRQAPVGEPSADTEARGEVEHGGEETVQQNGPEPVKENENDTVGPSCASQFLTPANETPGTTGSR
ncbi:hypothetical protein L209DRAFT_680652 [Thermothelomyces heterothallicus CBS 203.75]